jgi:hypothetical protein
MGLTVRSIEQADVETCGKIGFQAHKAVSSAHGYPSEQPSIEFAVGMIKTLLANPNSWGGYWRSGMVEFLAAYSFMYFHLLQLLQLVHLPWTHLPKAELAEC